VNSKQPWADMEGKMAYETKCVICDEAITNPICPTCLEHQVVQWVVEKKPSLVPIFKQIRTSIQAFTHENTTCILCKNNINVCPHCYCQEIYAWLSESEYISLAEEFKEKFNFELDHRHIQHHTSIV
jgi:hypothetical protein